MTATDALDGGSIVIDVWSDVTCPFCYLGETALTQALDTFPHGESVVVRHHGYPLMPDVVAGEVLGIEDHLVVQRGLPRAQAEAASAQLTEQGRAVGLDIRADRVIMAPTSDAHRLSHHAATRGRQREMVRRLFKACFTDGLDVSGHVVLADLAADVGLDADEARAVLGSGAFQQELDDDLRQARELSITGVPFFVVDGRYAVSGARPAEVFRQVLDTVWDEVAGTAAKAS